MTKINFYIFFRYEFHNGKRPEKESEASKLRGQGSNRSRKESDVE